MKSKVVKAGIGYTIGNYFLKGLSFLTLPIFSRLLTTEDYGNYNVFLAYESILALLIGVAIHSSYKNARFKFGIEENAKENGADYYTYVSVTMVMLVINTLIAVGILLVLSKPLMALLDINKTNIVLLVLYSFSTATILCFNFDASIEYQYVAFFRISLINALLNIGVSLFLIFTILSSQRYLARVLGTTLPAFFIAIYILIKFLRKAKPRNYGMFLKWGITFSFPIVFNGISQVILSQFDRIMIKTMVSPGSSGIYSFAYNIYTIVAVTYNSLDNVWNTWFFERMHESNYVEIRKKSCVYIVLMAVFTICVILVSPELILLLGSSKYYEAQFAAFPIIAGGYFTFLYTLPSAVEYYYEKTKFVAIGTVLAALINMILNYIFIGRFGYIAAAYTTLFTYILYFLFHYFLAFKIHKATLFDTKIILSSAACVVAMSYLALALNSNCILRWGIAIFLLLICVHFEEKKYGYLRRRFAKSGKC